MDRIVEVVESQAPKEKVIFASNGEVEFPPTELLSGAVGNKAWTVVFESTGDEHLKSQVEALSARVGNLEAENLHIKLLTCPPIIANIAAQVLLFLIGEQPVQPSPTCHRFGNGLNNETLRQKITEWATVLSGGKGWRASKFAKAADRLIDRRNNAIHAANISQLDDMVASATFLIDSSPTLSTSMAHEVMIIRHYSEIRSHIMSQHDGDDSDSDYEPDNAIGEEGELDDARI